MKSKKTINVPEISYTQKFSFKKEFNGTLNRFYFRYLVGEEILLEKDKRFWVLLADSHRKYDDCLIELSQNFVDSYLTAFIFD